MSSSISILLQLKHASLDLHLNSRLNNLYSPPPFRSRSIWAMTTMTRTERTGRGDVSLPESIWCSQRFSCSALAAAADHHVETSAAAEHHSLLMAPWWELQIKSFSVSLFFFFSHWHSVSWFGLLLLFSATRSNSGADSEQSRIRGKLKRFLQRRPTLQSVKEKGYIRGTEWTRTPTQFCLV